MMKHPFKDTYDFKVKYRFRTSEEGGRKTLPGQGYRSDFWYEHKDHKENQIFMIWPGFENSSGELISDGQALEEGIARMKIVNEKMLTYHKSKIVVGLKVHFMEGHRKVADCEVVELRSSLL